ncbi:two-component system VirA-like sensor kinase [Rhizobium ruizarguesonis]
MEANSKRPPRRRAIELWRILILVAGAFSFAIFAFGRVPSRETHEAILTSLRAVDINHASLQRDVLQARAGLLKNYDPLVASIKTLHATVTKLGELFPDSGVESPANLSDELSRLSSSIDRDEDLVEQFKTDNALLQNSLSIANQMLSKLHTEAPQEVEKGLDAPNDLGNLMMRFATQPSSALGQTIRSQLDAMQSTPYGDMPDVKSYIVHAKLILDTLPSVDSIIEAIQASQTSDDARRLQQVYLDAYGELSNRSSWSRLLLGSIAMLLCAYVAFLIYRLRLQTHKLTQQLDLEACIAEMRKKFEFGGYDSTAALTDSLAMIAHLFDASRYAFAILNIESGLTESTYGARGMLGFDTLREAFSIKIKDRDETSYAFWRPFFYENLQQRDLGHFPEGSLSAGSIVATELGNSVGLLFLEHAEIRKRPDRDEVRLLGQAIIALAQCVREQRENAERETLEARLEHAQRLEALGTLAGGIAHEFNNALGAILGYGEMALQLRKNSAKTREYVQEMVTSGHRAKFIIDQILTFSRKRDRVSQPFSVTDAIRDILPMAKMSVPDTFNIVLSLGEEASTVLGNPIEMQQVVMNLCTNAAHASRDVGEVNVAVNEVTKEVRTTLSHGELAPGTYVAVSVEDHGSGIPESALPHIFEPFFTTKSKRGGTGLGLAAVHGHVAGMNGKIDVRSHVNIGTRFDLYFPVSYRKPIPLADFFNERTVPLGTGQLVLVAQRDGSLRLLLEEKIAALGYEPVGFQTIGGVKNWLKDNNQVPDLIMLDLDLWNTAPDCRSVKAEFSPTPTVFLTDHETTTIDPRMLKGISVLRKPVSSINLATTLSNMVHGPFPMSDTERSA